MTTLHRHRHLPRRRPRQGHRRSQICRRVQRARPRPCRRRRLDHRQGPHRAHRHRARRCASTACSTCSPTRTGRRMADNDKAWKDDVAPEKARRSVRSMTTRSCSAGSRSRWCWPRTGRPRASPPRWSTSNMKRSPASPISHAQRDRPFVVEEAREAARRRRQGAIAAADVRHEAEYFIPTEHHNPMELFATTAVVGRRRQADGLRQDAGRAERAALSLQRVRHEAGRRARDVAVRGRRFGSGLRPQYQVVLAVLAARWRCSARCGSC